VTFLRALWDAWKRVAARIGHFQSRVILIVVYFVVVGPIALVMRMTGDPLGVKRTGSSWTTRVRAASLETARRQF
jgi:hypothetical protein